MHCSLLEGEDIRNRLNQIGHSYKMASWLNRSYFTSWLDSESVLKILVDIAIAKQYLQTPG